MTNLVEIFNEVAIMFSIYPMIVYTDFVSDPETQYLVGWASIVVAILHVCTNLYIIVDRSFKKLYHFIR